ncbi:MAG TPA: RNA 2',3'-cyclic phosphodiesterase [Acidobacteriaceae bacterium]|nr:RNA 2',3'-cyclic phosphodiesterase [Acidobacteriaceae bacterium]
MLASISSMRLFIAIALPDEATAVLRSLRDRLAPLSGNDLRWSAEEGWHVTLQFLGQAFDQQAGCVKTRLGEIHAAPVPIRIEGLDFFDRVGIFHAGIVLSPELLALQQKVTAATRPCGFVPEDRAFHPHITLARAKGRAGSRALAPLKQALRSHNENPAAAFTADEFLLYESFPGPEGSRYEIRARFPLTDH